MNITLYKLIPRKLISHLFYKMARIETPIIKNALIKIYCHITGANTSFAIEKNPLNYNSLNHFFTRALADGERPIDINNHTIISPVDGRCAIYGNIELGKLYQAKSQNYTLAALMNSQKDSESYQNGKTATLYLAPDDYHRIHMPCDGILTHMTFCPGDKHSVALDLLEHIPNLFVGNERLVCHFETPHGKMALIMVGALNVSSIETVWHGELKDNGNNHYHYSTAKSYKKGEEIGCFNLGSTVILCFENPAIELNNPKLKTGDKIYMGEGIAHHAR